MCGIVGKITQPQLANGLHESMHRMTGAIIHRGPDDSGHRVVGNRAIGMRRLSILDVDGGQQPISNEANDIHVVCNGEIYNFVELRRQLQRQGHQFRTHSDTEVIVHLYEEYGEGFVDHLRGMFALAILDERAGRVVLARDRLGKKPLFVAQRNGSTWFASEMKSLWQDDRELAEVAPSFLGHYLQFGYLPDCQTAYRHVVRVPAGHLATIDHNGFQSRAYWQLRFEEDRATSEQEWLEQLDQTIRESVRLRLRSDVPLGVFLSGGLDSSIVASYAAQEASSQLTTFTIGFDRREWDESDDAARVASYLGTKHQVLRLGEAELTQDFGETLDLIVHHTDEPFADASALPTYRISELAKQHVTVILSGDGGDELFAGYTAYQGALFAERYRKLPHWLGSRLLPSAASQLSHWARGGTRYKLQRVARVLRDSCLPLAESMRAKASLWELPRLQRLLSREAFESSSFVGPQFLPDSQWNTLNDDRPLLSRLCEIDAQTYMRDDILVKVDRMSMACSLEVRSPLLDHRVAELAARIPGGLKVRGGQGKWLLRKLMQSRLPKAALRKGKQGFSVPLREWFRGRLRDELHDRLLTQGDLPAEWICREEVGRTLAEHDRGDVDHANRLWALLILSAWHRAQQRRLGGVFDHAGSSQASAYGKEVATS